MSNSRVEFLIGIKESELVKLDSDSRSEFINGNTFINNKTYQPTPIGKFSTLSLNELRQLLSDEKKDQDKSDKNSQLCFSVNHCPLEVWENVDIGELQSRIKTTDRAMVQVASNFNCLEVPSKYIPPHYGNLIEKAHRDSTQGPAACFGPLAAYLYRAHFYEFLDGSIGQTGEQQINLLEDVSNYFGEPPNGKLELKGDEDDIESVDDVTPFIKIGLHYDAAIIFGREKSGLNYSIDKPYPLVDQVFSASINLNDYGKKTSKHNLIKICRTLLRSAYESIYLAAIQRERNILYLTLIGGGVFSNPISIILEEIVRAHKLYADHPKSCLKKVILCIYGENLKIVKTVKDLL